MKNFICLLFTLFVIHSVTLAQQSNKPDTSKAAVVHRLITHTLTKTDSAKINWQSHKNQIVDTLYTRFNESGLSLKNRTIDSTNLKIATCSFEDNVNAMVLFDIGILTSDELGLKLVRHKRIKIFNEEGKSAANILLPYINQFGTEQIESVEGETINLENGKILYTPLDQKLIYQESQDKYHNWTKFSMPNVKPGSIIEIAYVWRRLAPHSLPSWSFQSDLPTLYSQFFIQLFRNVKFTLLNHTSRPLLADAAILGGLGHTWAMADVPSLKNEPFMTSPVDYLQSLEFVLASAITPDGKNIDVAETWWTLGKQLVAQKDLAKTFEPNFNDKEGLVKKAKLLPTLDAKVSYLFNQVKTLMTWNGEKNWATKDGIKQAWEKKSGNWGEINMALCHLLNQSGVDALPLLVSTRDNGKIYPNFPNVYQINKLVVYIQGDSSKYYALDASGKFNIYNEVPFDLLNSYGLCINRYWDNYKLVNLKNDAPVKKLVSINAEIKPDGAMNGTAQLNSYGYNKTMALQLGKELDDKKYKLLLSDNDNELKILTLKSENAEVDSLPLVQNIDFQIDLPGKDEKYIYFNPNIFTGLHTNPFINERRFSDVDFGCVNLFSLNAKYKIPDGYKIEALPKSQTISVPDKSITFKRIVLAEEGNIIVYYVINYKQSFFPKDVYYQLYDFFKKTFEMLNEQIVLKKI